MENKKTAAKITPAKIVCFVVIGILLIVFIALPIVCSIIPQQIKAILVGTGEDFSGENVQQALQAGDELCRKMGEDSAVLLRNEKTGDDYALPLKADERKVNLFGVGAYGRGKDSTTPFLLKGIGSGSSTISTKRAKTLIDALEDHGITHNPDLESVYDSFNFRRSNYSLNEPDISKINAKLDAAREFSDVAIVVLSRIGGENIGEIPTTQGNDKNRTYLNISAKEEELLNVVTNNFGKVIVLINTCNAMHLGFLETMDIDAAMYIGITGQSAAEGVVKLLTGEANPSGKLTDTYVYTPEYDPTFNNFTKVNEHVQYINDIYHGYKWYETADAEGFFDNVSNDYGTGYDGVVQYPFGYGMSYSDKFEWEITKVTLPDKSKLTKDSKVTVSVAVTNKSESRVAGSDVVQLYYTPKYHENGIEKAEVNLLDFAKTAVLEYDKTQIVDLSFSAYDMASYDCYDKNGNGEATFELDADDYVIKLMKNAHEIKDESLKLTYTVDKDIIFDEGANGSTVENRFTGDNAYGGVPIDGHTVGAETTYLTRADFEGTFPTKHTRTPSNSTEYNKGKYFMNDAYEVDMDIQQGQPGNLRLTNADGTFNEELMTTLAKDYDDPMWDSLLNQIKDSELKALVELGGFRTQEVNSVGKPLCKDYDGPAGFNTNSLTGTWGGEAVDTEKWTAYPSESLIGCSWNKSLLLEMGLSMGAEGTATQCNGWYAPGVNLHRSAYTARNFEYYSEDGVLSGKLAAQVIKGAKANGLYCYLKHFACSELGQNANGVYTWLTEQNLRENFLKPFEIAVKEGGANAMMSAFNRIGASWAGSNYGLLKQILRDEWGFRGSVITDWTMGEASGGMYTRQGVRAGNDLWLNPGNTINNGLDMSKDRPYARQAAKNIIFTYVDTWYFNHTVNMEELMAGATKAEIGVYKRANTDWVITLIVVLSIVGIVGMLVWLFFLIWPMIKHFFIKTPAADTGAGEAEVQSDAPTEPAQDVKDETHTDDSAEENK